MKDLQYKPIKRLRKGLLYVMFEERQTFSGSGTWIKEWTVVDIRMYRPGYVPKHKILGVYIPRANDCFEIDDGHLAGYRPVARGTSLASAMKENGATVAYRIRCPKI